jgi:hypothetical protein
MNRIWRNQPRPQKRCWCGSGKKQKNCHGGQPAAMEDATTGNLGAQPPVSPGGPHVTPAPWGVPGEEHKVIVAPIVKGAGMPTAADIQGQRGKYLVQFLLARPGYPIRREREANFIDEAVGTSHVKIAKPEVDRGITDVHRLAVTLFPKNYQVLGIPDKNGFLGKLTCELEADNSQAAEVEAYGSLAPILSSWSMNLDVPIHVETIQVTNLTSHVSSLRVVTPHFEMNFATGGAHPHFRDEFCQYASIYREGLNSNSAFYRFLCFYKIIESLIAKRGREASDRKSAGQNPSRMYEVIPAKDADMLALLKRLYPWRNSWDKMALSQIFPADVLGQKVTAIRDRHFRPLRLGIAHALLDSGEITVVLDKIEYVRAVNKWLPLCRISARWMLLTDFPVECSIGMK